MVTNNIHQLLTTRIKKIRNRQVFQHLLFKVQITSRIYVVLNGFTTGAICQFLFRWIYYCNSSKFTGNETDKTHICAPVQKCHCVKIEKLPKWHFEI